ncbi:UDP-glucose 4-epimerase GalE [Lampropedia aestuarii]|uniref:UDP-glucose 4-epimerase n=1 Tax=Lampropedia aestuarii TaxID=2562762 RepID=A0A4S5BY02_9BURK|nr:UDP-glucose 4-epimerase GalE [Lampropedia aestuarii]MDH5856611.1 UDP-glucose 4-epimerase GalE [Lampropedia aestuarii]THJ34876.1 UDP-glucose 4-epimerase GalE [Lampropedia aestuarii]
MHILVTGGAGYIGAHTVVELLQAGHQVHVVDNLCNSSAQALTRIASICGTTAGFTQADIRDTATITALLQTHAIDAVIHFAGLKAVGESVQQALRYYDNNVAGSLSLLKAMDAAQVRSLVFSSSATVYGPLAPVPYQERMPLGIASNPYGSSKIMVEQCLADLCAADARWSVAALRYFNPIGAHPSGLIGEDPQGIPNNLLPFITQVAVGRRSHLSIFGDDYDTPDGTCLRDYLHVVDLAKGHLAALAKLAELAASASTAGSGLKAWNLGTGRGSSVLEIVRAFEQVNGITIPYQMAPRRSGDLPAFWADASLAAQELQWHAELPLEAMVRDAWHWQSNNPQGYGS